MRPGPDQRAELVERIYDAAFDDAALDQLSVNLGEALGVEQVLVSTRRGREIIDLAILGPPRAMEDYAAHYWRIDPWTPAILGVAPGRFAFGDELVPTAVVKESEFYNDFARPQGVLFPMDGRADARPEKSRQVQTYLNISINRPGARARIPRGRPARSRRSRRSRAAHGATALRQASAGAWRTVRLPPRRSTGSRSGWR